MVAEYERAKIMERSRRGKRHAAFSGSVNVLSCAPYGYRYVNKDQGGGQAYYEVNVEQAQVVRQIFEWVGLALNSNKTDRPSRGCHSQYPCLYKHK